jgi:hypothetical protein
MQNLKIKIINYVLPKILHGCETWSPTLRDQNRLRVFDNGVLMRIFGPKREKET